MKVCMYARARVHAHIHICMHTQATYPITVPPSTLNRTPHFQHPPPPAPPYMRRMRACHGVIQDMNPLLARAMRGRDKQQLITRFVGMTTAYTYSKRAL